jgi:hypothetical protein
LKPEETETPVKPAPKNKTKKAVVKTGTVRYESVLYVDTCSHASSKTIPAGSKVRILGRVGIEWTDGCLNTGDLVKVSFEGVTGWVDAIAVLEEIVAPVAQETQDEKDCIALGMPRTCKS